MHPIEAFVRNPVKVAVGVLLVVLFGVIAIFRMPLQLTPEVQIPTITIETRWPGASPQEVEREIIQEQEEQLKGVENLVKLSSECMDSSGKITLEFVVGTDITKALLIVSSRLQQVPEYPLDADEPVITTSGSGNAIAWFILSERLPTDATIRKFQETYPRLADDLDAVVRAHNEGLASLRLRRLFDKSPEFQQLRPGRLDTEKLVAFQQQNPQLAELLEPVFQANDSTEAVWQLRHLIAERPEFADLAPTPIDVPKERKFAEDFIEARFERVDGVSNSNVFGGQDPELQVVVDPRRLAARNLTIADLRRALQLQNQDTSGGDFWEGKRRYVVRTLGQFRSPEEVAKTVVAVRDSTPVFVKDVADVQLGYRKPASMVRRFGTESIAVNAERESGANVMAVMEGLRATNRELNDELLYPRGLQLVQVYDETEYIESAVGLVNQNIILGGSLTVIVLMLFLHLSTRTFLVVPIIFVTAVAAVVLTPWLFVITLAVILAAGFWFARGALVVSLAIPTSVVGTFLLLNLMGRSLNVISLAGLAFAIGMLVDNAVVVLENVYRHYAMGDPPVTAAVRATKEVWGAVIASTLTTIAVFIPVVFVQEEAGQLFLDIALAICCAVGLSLLVSVTVIPTASARLFHGQDEEDDLKTPAATSRAVRRSSKWLSPLGWLLATLGRMFVDHVVWVNLWVQQRTWRRLTVIIVLVGASVVISYQLWPPVEYLPTGNRNLVFGILLPPPGYNLNKQAELGQRLERSLQPYWDFDEEDLEEWDKPLPPIDDFFYVAAGRQVFMGLRAADPMRAAQMVPMVYQVSGRIPGTFVMASQMSLFGRDLTAGRTIDIEITGPQLERLVMLGGQIIGQVGQEIRVELPGSTEEEPQYATAMAFPKPSLDLSNPEIHVKRKSIQAGDLGVDATELGYTVNALVDGAYATDYFTGGDKIDLVILGAPEYAGRTQDLEALPIATPAGQWVPLGALAEVDIEGGPEQINRRERERAITIQVMPPPQMALEEAIGKINTQIVGPIRQSGQLAGGYKIRLSGTADKLRTTWDALKWNVLLALIITYLLMAALFESWLYPLVVIFSVPLGAVGGIAGLYVLNIYLAAMGSTPQLLDVLTMLGFVILIGTVVNNAILIVHQSLNHIRFDEMNHREAILESVRSRIRPIFMTTATTVCGLSPLVFFPGAGSELYRGLGAVVLGGLVVSTMFTLLLVPTLFSLMMDLRDRLRPARKTVAAPSELVLEVDTEEKVLAEA